MIKQTLILSLVILCAFGFSPSRRAYATEIAPHKALYKITLRSKAPSAQIVNVSGEMLYEVHADCEAWITDHSLNAYYDYAEKPSMHIKNDYSTYETMDGEHMSFNAQKRRNAIPYQEIRGRAELGDTNKATLSRPEAITHDLSSNTFFPMSHTIEVLRRMSAGDKLFTSHIYDGSDERGALMISAFLGSTIKPDKAQRRSEKIDQGLINAPARHVRLAFFPPSDVQASAPEYEMSVALHENGVINDMSVEYEDFSVSQNLIALEAKDNTCAGAPKNTQ